MARFLRSVLAAATLATTALAAGLDDAPPVTGVAAMPLDGVGWTASSAVYTIGATVPGDLITDLQRAGIIGARLTLESIMPI